MTQSGQPGPGQSRALALERDAGEVVAGSGVKSVAAGAPLATGGRADDAVSAFSLLQRRVTLSITGVLLALAGLAWFLTWRQNEAIMMGGGPSAAVFLPMWVSMMVAMMFPTIAPIVLAHRTVVARRGEGPLPTAALVTGYLAIWALAGLVPLAAIIAVGTLGSAAPGRWVSVLGGVILVAAGLYQFSSWKGICLSACRHPIGFVLTHDFGSGARGAFRSGASHGLYCLGCCWALMTVLVLVGLMNLGWMALLTIIFLGEKNWRYGVELSRAAGTLVGLLGIAIIVDPEVLSLLSGGILSPAM